MNELAIRRVLNDSTRKQGVMVGTPGKGGEVYSLHITHNREAIITDNRDYGKIYAVISLDLYNLMTK